MDFINVIIIFSQPSLEWSSTFIVQGSGPNPKEKATMNTTKQTNGSQPILKDLVNGFGNHVCLGPLLTQIRDSIWV